MSTELSDKHFLQEQQERKNKEIAAVKRLGEVIGYGNLMSIASALWRKKLADMGFPEGGGFVPALLRHIDQEVREKTQVERDAYDDFVKTYFLSNPS
jgi:hypothetical protein